MKDKLFGKVLLGIATLFYVLLPLFLFGLWLFTIPFMIIASQQYSNDPPVLVFFVFALFMLGFMFSTLLHFILLPIYMYLLLKERRGSDLVRTLFGVGLLFIPWLAALVYYLAFIAPADPPAWILDPDKAESASIAQAAAEPTAPGYSGDEVALA